ncbi:PLP-dependent aminotransferase family protein [Paenibacillus mesophilus]|uniref:MocR-like pyridoxine biosynthesis transcription factor PdxR n=1 Tax=Paenibacillus mesophilus TaxID=2582849 RepID=UPI00110E22B1|nr:PLP-dependent aminotransferase family protein [Paenibacillus mesophilus]TMV49451.1 PLP-dependent aminotransferase family protein [Paenibacillus mesophilus]
MELLPLLDAQSVEPLYSQLYRHIRGEIEAGRLRAGSRLPSVRKLAAHLGISRTPVEDAYQQLLAEGYAASRPRSGITVQIYEPEFSRGFYRTSSAEPGRKESPRLVLPAKKADPSIPVHAGEKTDWIDFSYGDIDLSHFPFPLWKKLLGSCFSPDHRDLFRYGDPLGESGFREALSDYAYRARAVICPPERIVVGAGTHHSTEQICRLLQRTPYSAAHSPIAVEQSMSDGIAAIMRQHGYRLVPLRLEPDGIRIEDLYDSGARIVYTTPSHQFPHGMVMSIGKRRRLLNWAADVGGLIVEDDYDGEFRYAGLPIPSLQGLDAAANCVVYMGTFSRALAPAFRLSYTALPPALAIAAKAALHPFDRLASPLHQKTLELFMAGGHMQRHIRKMRSVYQRKMAALLAAVRRCLEPRFRVSGGGAGLHVLLETDDGRDEAQLIRLAEAAGVRVYPTSVYRIDPHRGESASILLGFGGLDERRIEEGVRRLADVWKR